MCTMIVSDDAEVYMREYTVKIVMNRASWLCVDQTTTVVLS